MQSRSLICSCHSGDSALKVKTGVDNGEFYYKCLMCPFPLHFATQNEISNHMFEIHQLQWSMAAGITLNNFNHRQSVNDLACGVDG